MTLEYIVALGALPFFSYHLPEPFVPHGSLAHLIRGYQFFLGDPVGVYPYPEISSYLVTRIVFRLPRYPPDYPLSRPFPHCISVVEKVRINPEVRIRGYLVFARIQKFGVLAVLSCEDGHVRPPWSVRVEFRHQYYIGGLPALKDICKALGMEAACYERSRLLAFFSHGLQGIIYERPVPFAREAVETYGFAYGFK